MNRTLLLEAAVFRLPHLSQELSIVKHSSNSIHVTVQTYCEVDGKVWVHSGGIIAFDTPQFANQVMNVGRELFGKDAGGVPTMTPEQLTELMLVIEQFRA